MKSFNQEWWNTDIANYMRWKALLEKYPESTTLPLTVAERRANMVERYGETAMKGI